MCFGSGRGSSTSTTSPITGQQDPNRNKLSTTSGTMTGVDKLLEVKKKSDKEKTSGMTASDTYKG